MKQIVEELAKVSDEAERRLLENDSLNKNYEALLKVRVNVKRPFAMSAKLNPCFITGVRTVVAIVSCYWGMTRTQRGTWAE